MVSNDPWIVREHARIMARDAATKAAKLRKEADKIFYTKRKDADALYKQASALDKECVRWCSEAAHIIL
jgi:hypothetical protein